MRSMVARYCIVGRCKYLHEIGKWGEKANTAGRLILPPMKPNFIYVGDGFVLVFSRMVIKRLIQ
jgi:hypothetical protein